MKLEVKRLSVLSIILFNLFHTSSAGAQNRQEGAAYNQCIQNAFNKHNPLYLQCRNNYCRSITDRNYKYDTHLCKAQYNQRSLFNPFFRATENYVRENTGNQSPCVCSRRIEISQRARNEFWICSAYVKQHNRIFSTNYYSAEQIPRRCSIN
jgi:hypothetical protein